MVGMTGAAATWHDVENGSYDADLPLWRELARAAGGPVLDLGSGTGRVALDLAARGHDVVALDSDAELLAELAGRAPSVATVKADVRSFALETTFALVIAPMQLVQIVGGRAGRAAMLERVLAHLDTGGLFAAALSDVHDALPREQAAPPLPDILERDGWVFSSQPLSVHEERDRVVIERRRQAVSPAGEIEAEEARIELDVLSAAQFADELRAAGLTSVELRTIPETLDHIGSTVVLCRR
jgi:SAM-dependent methyltransferase